MTQSYNSDNLNAALSYHLQLHDSWRHHLLGGQKSDPHAAAQRNIILMLRSSEATSCHSVHE